MFLLLLKLKSNDFCSRVIEQQYCIDYIEDCVLDGEQLSWCKESYYDHMAEVKK